MSIVNKIKNHLINVPGWSTNRKIIVFESDDWGSIRMVDKKSFDILIKNGIRVDTSLYNSLDSLETQSDLENLFGVLSRYKTDLQSVPIFTFNTVMGNPDFEKIQESGFVRFYHEHFYDSYKKYYGKDLKSLWEEGINSKIIQPQFHAREHLHSELWLRDLKMNNKETRIAFNSCFFGLKTKTSEPNQSHYLAAYRAENKEDFEIIKLITIEGLKMFEDTFGFRSKTFIGCNYTWPQELEETLHKEAVTMLQGQRVQLAPSINGGKLNFIRNYTGKTNLNKQFFTVRNVLFEPYLNQEADWVDKAMKEIATAFFWKKPAIISSHRINFSGNMSKKNRDSSLKKLDTLLGEIIKRYPDVEFMSSDQLYNIMSQ